MANVLKHAKATKIWLKLHVEAGSVFLSVVDDGRGFEQNDMFSPVGGHFGLIGMRERAERLGGELHLSTGLGQGTRIQVTVPLS